MGRAKSRNNTKQDNALFNLPQLPSLLTQPLGLEGWTAYEPVLLAALTVGATSGLLAVERKGHDLSRLGQIVVTAGRTPEKRADVAASVSVITAEQVAASSSADLGELLAEHSFGHIQKYPGASTSVGIRGFTTEAHGNDLKGQVVILVNGRVPLQRARLSVPFVTQSCKHGVACERES